eukprot:2495158-Rhodomonas_salina.2
MSRVSTGLGQWACRRIAKSIRPRSSYQRWSYLEDVCQHMIAHSSKCIARYCMLKGHVIAIA